MALNPSWCGRDETGPTCPPECGGRDGHPSSPGATSPADSCSWGMEMRRTVQRTREGGREGGDRKGIWSRCIRPTHSSTYLGRQSGKKQREIRTIRKTSGVRRRRHDMDKGKDKRLPGRQ